MRLASATRLPGRGWPTRGGRQMRWERGLRRLGIRAGALVLLTACGGTSTSSTTTSAANAKSAADVGGIDALVTAAKKEGKLNIIAVPPDWANYGEIITGFTAKYGIPIDSANPNGTSQDEVNAVQQLAGTSRAPDVLDIGKAVTLANLNLNAPYKLQTWNDILATQKEATGLWVQDYGGWLRARRRPPQGAARTSAPDPSGGRGRLATHRHR